MSKKQPRINEATRVELLAAAAQREAAAEAILLREVKVAGDWAKRSAKAAEMTHRDILALANKLLAQNSAPIPWWVPISWIATFFIGAGISVWILT